MNGQAYWQSGLSSMPLRRSICCRTQRPPPDGSPTPFGTPCGPSGDSSLHGAHCACGRRRSGYRANRVSAIHAIHCQKGEPTPMRLGRLLLPEGLRLFENTFNGLHPEALTCLDNGTGRHERTLAGQDNIELINDLPHRDMPKSAMPTIDQTKR